MYTRRYFDEDVSDSLSEGQSPSRVGKKSVTVYYGKEAHLQLKILAAENETTIQELHQDALNALFVKHGKPPIA